jgi:hypothetical protein
VTLVTPQATSLTHPVSQQPWWTLDWTVGRVAIITLFILLLVAFVAAWLLRRRRIDAATSARGKDKAA